MQTNNVNQSGSLDGTALHTKEPWKIGAASGGNVNINSVNDKATNGKHVLVARVPTAKEANARRIVACVNACAGIPTDELEEQGKQGKVIKFSACTACEQRDELLAALKGITRIVQALSFTITLKRNQMERCEAAKSLIARLEQS